MIEYINKTNIFIYIYILECIVNLRLSNEHHRGPLTCKESDHPVNL